MLYVSFSMYELLRHSIHYSVKWLSINHVPLNSFKSSKLNLGDFQKKL